MLNQVMHETARRGADVETLLLRKMDIQMCRGCLACEEGGRQRPGICTIRDDMNGVYQKLLTADVIVLATPAYFEMLSGLLKNFLDRTVAIWPRLEGKRIAGIAVAEEDVGSTIQNLKVYASLCKMQWMGSVTVLAKNPGDVKQKKGLERRLKRLSKKLLA
jgi:multimeric flavodoxin WrbA